MRGKIKANAAVDEQTFNEKRQFCRTRNEKQIVEVPSVGMRDRKHVCGEKSADRVGNE